MHVIFISPVAGEQATVEEGCGLILIKPPAIQVIYVAVSYTHLVNE